MAYVANQVSCIYTGGAGGQKWWSYITVDALATVEGASYFTDESKLFQAGDLIFIHVVDSVRSPTTVSAYGIYAITAVSSGGVATIVNYVDGIDTRSNWDTTDTSDNRYILNKPRIFESNSSLTADTGLSYSGTDAVVAGDPVYVQAERCMYTVAATGAADYIIQTAGSVKLYDGIRGWDLSSGHTQYALQKLQNDESLDIVFLGDSTGDATTEWVYRLLEILGARFLTHTVQHRLWDTGSDNYGSVTSIQTGTGSGTLRGWNGSIAGATASQFLGEHFESAVRPATIGGDPDLVIVSYGHNGGSDIERQFPMHATLLGEIARLLPFTPVIVVGQNPVTTDSTMLEKIRTFRSLVNSQGYGFIDVHDVFRNLPNTLTDYYLASDTVHPNATGSDVWARVIDNAFTPNRNAIGGVADPSLNRSVIVAENSFIAMNGWTPTAGVTLSKDVANFETNGESILLTGTGVAIDSYITKVLINSEDIGAYRGRYVTLAVRVKVPDGSNVHAGRIALYDGTTTHTSSNGGPQGADFYTQSISIKVGSAAVAVTGFIYLITTSAGTTDTINVDRFTLSDGMLPQDSALPSTIENLDHLKLLGGDAAGLLTVRNTSNAGTAIQVLDTSAGSNTDDPETQFKSSLSAGGVKTKERGDAFERIRLNPDGKIYLGYGTLTPAIYFESTGLGLLRLGGNAHFYPVVDSTQDLGLSNIKWRTIYADTYSLAQFVNLQAGTGSPEGVVSSSPGGMYLRTDGAAGTTLYIKETGTGNTGWVGFAGPVDKSFTAFSTTDATPSVDGGLNFETADTTTYTDFDDAAEGQEITILALHAATVTNNANIGTSTGANKTLTVGVAYKFISRSGKWHEFATA